MDYITPITLGFFGSFHCMGMCGPIAFALPFKRKDQTGILLDMFLYHSGRITMYILIGLVSGLLGAGIRMSGFQQYLSILLGVAMILTATIPLLFQENNFISAASDKLNFIKKPFAKYLNIQSHSSVVFIGLLNGLLPCGLSHRSVWFYLLSGRSEFHRPD